MQFLTASASVSSPVPPSAHILRLSRPPPFPHLRRRCSPPKPLTLNLRPPLHIARRPLLFTPRAHGGHGHGHDHHHHGHDHHHHGHGHGHHGVDVHGSGGGAVVMRVAKAIGWAGVADALREHLQLCCVSLGLLLIAAVCPHVALLNSFSRLQGILIAVAFPLVGVSAALDALVNIADGRINIHVLMALAAFASIFMGNSLEGGLLLAMFNLAHIAEEYFTSKSMIDVRELKENHPEFALLLETSGDESVPFSNLSYTKVPVHDLKVGSHILVRAGEAVPVDGEVYQGASTVTIEHLTGETKPLERTVGDAIPGGARNLEGMMIVKVTKSWDDSTLNRIVQLTEEGQLNKPKLQRWLDEFGEHYSRVVVALSLIVAFLGPFLFKWPFFGNSVCRGSIYRGLGLMVAASPCALAVAPLAYATAISSLASKGILLKGGHVLDALASCQSIAFDKTGTLTTGKLKCKAIEPIHGHLVVKNGLSDSSCCTPNCESEALAVAAAMEEGTTHPIGRAVLDHSVGKELPVVSVESFECLPGRGVEATLSGVKAKNNENELAKASIGSVEYISSLYRSSGESEQIKQAAKSSAYGPEFVQAALSVDKKVTLFHFEDEPRSGVCEVISTLREKAKLRIMMLTGDHESSALRVAKAVCIDEVRQSLGNILQKDRDHSYSEDSECDIIDHDFNSTTAVGETTELCGTKNVDALGVSSDLISHDLCEPSGDHAMNSDSHHMSYSQSKFPRSQSAVFQNDCTSDQEGSVDSEILGSRCRSVDGLCSLFDEKVGYLSGSEMHRCQSNLDLYSGPSPDIYRTLNMEDNGSLGCSDAADEGQRSSGSAEEQFVRDGMLVGHEYWDVKYISGDHSVNPVAPFCTDLGDVSNRSAIDSGLNEAMDQEIEEKLRNRDSTHHKQSLVVEVPDPWNMSNTNDISEEPEHSKTDIDGDPKELTPRTYSIKRIEEWISQIEMDDITVDEQGESSSSALAKSSEPVTGVSAVRPDAKSPLGMEIAYTYISKLTPVSSSAQLANLGLVAIPRLSAFAGLRLLNLSGNSIVRVTAGALPKGLHVLSLSKNNISTIEGLRELTRLRLLDISYNRISRIGHGLASCSSLKEIYLAGNKISEVDGLHRLLKLKVLDLRYNKISTSKGLGQLAANYNSLEAINLDGNPAQKNVGDEHLKKYLLGLLPNLVVYNKQPIRATGSKDVSDRHSRKISSSHRSDRGVRSDRKSSRLVGGSSSHKTQSSRHARSGYAYGSGSSMKHSRGRNFPISLMGSRPAEQVNAVDLTKQTQIEGKAQ